MCTPVVAASEAATRPRRIAIQRSGSSSSAEVERFTPGTTLSVSRSMSGCKKRLKSTSPSAPASARRRAMLAIELKYGPTLTASGIVTTSRTARTSSR